MAFIHLKVTPDSRTKEARYSLDGYGKTRFTKEQYIEVDAGTHALVFENDEVKWNVRAHIGESQVLEIILVAGYDGIVCAPEYHVKDLDGFDYIDINEKTDKQNCDEHHKEWIFKFDNRKLAGIKCMIFGAFVLLVSIIYTIILLAQAKNEIEAIVALSTLVLAVLVCGIIILIGVIIWRKSKKKIKMRLAAYESELKSIEEEAENKRASLRRRLEADEDDD